MRQRILHLCVKQLRRWSLPLILILWIASTSRPLPPVRAAQTAPRAAQAQPPSAQSSQLAMPSQSAATWLGSDACAVCHRQIYDEFKQTSMGRSIVPVTPALLQTMHLPVSYDDQKLNRHFSVYAQNGTLYQSESQIDASGHEVFRDIHPLQWKIGAGENGFGLLTTRDHYLFQAPLSFYAKPMSWGPSPGYEFADYGFNRPILAGCIICHSSRPNPVPAANGRYEDPPFTEAAIGCERCHGPGSTHVQAMEGRISRPAGEDFIVNPAHLTPYLANNICMYCHQTGDVRILQPGKHFSDFHPGMPLDDVLAILKVPPTRESPPDDDHVEHYYSMTLSKCYRASGERLRCITCHDPHIEPTAQEAPAFYNKKCLTCHTTHSCTLPAAARRRSTPADNCIGCHMPKRDIQAISHSSATNHRIVRRPGEPFPDVTFQQTSAGLPDLIHLDPAPGKPASALPPLTLLQAYGELAENKPQYLAPYLKVLDQLSQSQPDSALVQAALGRKALKDGDTLQAADHLRRSLQLDPAQPAVAGDMADALQKLGHTDEAAALLRKAVDQDPFNPVLHKKLIVSYIALHRYPEAKAAIETYLNIFPQDSFMRQMLARVQGASTAR
ncbi:cytochrome c3 family protein [Paracidobacterium acidisoli]|uniref:Tetratricopeptide repeat protein n=1 Tax=Paracidobacterium acidisoli TaxID=2303751 RepID=A0A372ISJ2_9BACT|nr:cytochrome c3 family protein [Paracidobacterium acidisoli]MBT9330838.1 tetratricopeptide repeat protein [Paracidobacterium acidisoli]